MNENYIIPYSIKNLFPDYLQKAVNNEIDDITTKNRKEALMMDNINDFVYYGNKKKLFKGSQFDSVIKEWQMTPLEYAKKNKKIKCFIYLIIREYGLKFSNELFNPFDEQDYDWPEWYKILYFYTNGLEKFTISEIYSIMMNSKEPIKYIKCILDKNPEYFSKDSEKTQEQDVNLYRSLSEEDKNEIIKLCSEKKIFLKIQDYLFEEGNLSRISKVFGYYKLAEYCVKQKKIEEFKKYVDQNPNIFSNLQNCHIIMPQFTELYQYAYAKSHYKDDGNDDNYQYIREHTMQLAYHNFYKELKFIFKMGFTLKSSNDYLRIVKWKEPKVINVLPTCEIDSAIEYLFQNEPETFLKLNKLGYRPKYSSIHFVLTKQGTNLPYVKTLEILDFVSEEYLDSFKFPIIQYHPELAPLFVKKYSNRIKDKSPESWHLEWLKPRRTFERACEILGFDKNLFNYKSETNSSSSSDDDNDDYEDKTSTSKSESKSRKTDYNRYAYKKPSSPPPKRMKYYCKYCKSIGSGLRMSGKCSLSPTGNHKMFLDDGRSVYSCQMCGSQSPISLICSSNCSKSPTNHHVAFTSPDMKKYVCMYCGDSGSSISSLTSGYCKRAPKTHHVPYDGDVNKSCTCKYCSSHSSSISYLAKGDCKKSPTGRHFPSEI